MTKLWNPQELAEVLGVSLPDPKVNGHNASAPGDTEPFQLNDYPSVQAALDHVTVPADRSTDHYRVLCACYDARLTLAQARWAVNRRPDLAGRLGERRDDDVAKCWWKIDTERRRNTFSDGTVGGAQNTKDNTAGWLSDAHVSELLVNRVLRGKYCWAHGLGWMRWDGTKWSRTTTEDAVEQSRLFANTLVASVVDSGNPDKIRAYTRRMSAGAVRAAADLAKGQLLVDAAQFDRQPRPAERRQRRGRPAHRRTHAARPRPAAHQVCADQLPRRRGTL